MGLGPDHQRAVVGQVRGRVAAALGQRNLRDRAGAGEERAADERIRGAVPDGPVGARNGDDIAAAKRY
jgi:hypothetical protein